MIPHIFNSTLILASSLTLLFLMWKTNSLYASVSTTLSIFTVTIGTLLFIVGYPNVALCIGIISMSVLVWRVIPHDHIDSWVK